MPGQRARRWQVLSRGARYGLPTPSPCLVSATLDEPSWGNATVLAGDVVNEVSKLRQRLDGDIVVYGSVQLAHTLIEHDLADEVRLFIYPVVVGTGWRLFGEVSEIKPMRLVQAQSVGDSLALLTYQSG